MSHSDTRSHGPAALQLPSSGTLARKLHQARSTLEEGKFGISSDSSLRRQVKTFQSDVETLTQHVARVLEFSRTLRTRPDVKQLLQESDITRQRKVGLRTWCHWSVYS